MDHEFFMREALVSARRALKRNEFPVGCVLVHQGRIIARGQRTGTCKAVPGELEHAEIRALRRLEQLPAQIAREEVVLYSTMEPCLMCYGAILISGIGTIVYAYEDAMGGGTGCDRTRLSPLYAGNKITIIPGICRAESLALFKSYFGAPQTVYWRGSLLSDYTLDQN